MESTAEHTCKIKEAQKGDALHSGNLGNSPASQAVRQDEPPSSVGVCHRCLSRTCRDLRVSAEAHGAGQDSQQKMRWEGLLGQMSPKRAFVEERIWLIVATLEECVNQYRYNLIGGVWNLRWTMFGLDHCWFCVGGHRSGRAGSGRLTTSSDG